MSIYVPQYKDYDLDAVPNCMCGDNGRSRNEHECKRQGGCSGCGFDRTEYMRRINLIHDGGLQPITEDQRNALREKWKAKIDADHRIVGLRVRAKM